MSANDKPLQRTILQMLPITRILSISSYVRATQISQSPFWNLRTTVSSHQWILRVQLHEMRIMPRIEMNLMISPKLYEYPIELSSVRKQTCSAAFSRGCVNILLWRNTCRCHNTYISWITSLPKPMGNLNADVGNIYVVNPTRNIIKFWRITSSTEPLV